MRGLPFVLQSDRGERPPSQTRTLPRNLIAALQALHAPRYAINGMRLFLGIGGGSGHPIAEQATVFARSEKRDRSFRTRLPSAHLELLLV